ncbi:protein FAR1-RELATED SEQUENCE 5-like [Lotus japonicus]|uniref:protein FAR1-RELATED SEQUENCE 5-like n=1 Tax=Lotus japonicus TaxID=34305 RepID=UPI00258FAC8E|nr:protein FAR1-RELATED SEQUENCE 5-like [Lotus japonicus]
MMNIGVVPAEKRDEPAIPNFNDEWKDNIEHEVTQEDITPFVGMEFDTKDHAYRFYNLYGGFMGFSIRKDWRNTSKSDKEIVISRKYVCFKEGFKRNKDVDGKIARKDIRTGCLAHMVIGRASSGKYVVTSFVKENNHEMATPKSKHKLPSHLSVSQAAEVEMETRSGICQKLIFEFMSRQAGGRENVGCTAKDISNHLSSKRMKEMEEGETPST